MSRLTGTLISKKKYIQITVKKNVRTTVKITVSIKVKKMRRLSGAITNFTTYDHINSEKNCEIPKKFGGEKGNERVIQKSLVPLT